MIKKLDIVIIEFYYQFGYEELISRCSLKMENLQYKLNDRNKQTLIFDTKEIFGQDFNPFDFTKYYFYIPCISIETIDYLPRIDDQGNFHFEHDV